MNTIGLWCDRAECFTVPTYNVTLTRSEGEMLYDRNRQKHGSTYRQSCGVRYREREKTGRGGSAACLKILI